MSHIAVIKTGGKQYLVQEGQELRIEKLELEPGSSLSFDALLVSEMDGSSTSIGTPMLSDKKVMAKILAHGKADKISVIKYKSKSRYRRNVGHRQPFTKIHIEKITA